jgi:hypothetical protein
MANQYIVNRINKVSQEQNINNVFAYYRDEIDQIWLANHDPDAKDHHWESDK